MSERLTREQIEHYRQFFRHSGHITADARHELNALCDMALSSLSEGWVSVEERLPKSGVPVIAHYKTDNGYDRRVRAFWAAAGTLEPGENTPDDFCDESGYCPEGWYESNENDETDWLITNEVIRWHPLPDLPSPPVGKD